MVTNFLTGVKVNPPSLMNQVLQGYGRVLPDRELVIENFSILNGNELFYFFRTRFSCFESRAEYSLCRKISKSAYDHALSIYRTRLNQSQAQGLLKYTQTTIWDFI